MSPKVQSLTYRIGCFAPGCDEVYETSCHAYLDPTWVAPRPMIPVTWRRVDNVVFCHKHEIRTTWIIDGETIHDYTMKPLA